MTFSFAEKVIVIREYGQSSGKELGEMLGVGKSTIHHYETGKTEPQDREIRKKVEMMFVDVWVKFRGMKIRELRNGKQRRYRRARVGWQGI